MAPVGVPAPLRFSVSLIVQERKGHGQPGENGAMVDVKWPLTQALSCHVNINNRPGVVPGAPGTWLLHWWPRTWSLSPSMFVTNVDWMLWPCVNLTTRVGRFWLCAPADCGWAANQAQRPWCSQDRGPAPGVGDVRVWPGWPQRGARGRSATGRPVADP